MNSDTGRLTRETHSTLILTTTTLIQLIKYCVDELHKSYLLTGKIQADELEHRFSLYRRLAVCNYNVSIRQIYEIKKKKSLRTCLLLKLSINSFKNGEVPVTNLYEDNFEDVNEIQIHESLCDIEISNDELNYLNDYIVLITYLAGYCISSVCKRLKC